MRGIEKINFNEKLIELRKKNGLSQEELGSKLNVARQTVSKWELGETTPEMEKLIELSRIFKISIDELTGNEIYKNTTQKYNGKIRMEYEYKSKTKIKGIPLVHINVGFGVKKAKGIIAIGNIAQGLISIGGIAMGLIALGGLGIGLLSISGIALGLILAIGGISLGTISIGGLSLGVFAIGGCAIGIYAIGGGAFAKNIAIGGYSSGHIAIGEQVNGANKFIVENGVKTFTSEEVKNTILKEFPKTLKIIVSIFSNV